MMNDMLLRKERILENGLQLIKAGSFVGLTNIDFLDENNTIKEYKKWERESLQNVLSISEPEWSLQYIYKSSIDEIRTMGILQQEVFDEFKNLTEEDVLVPFLGNIKHRNFSTLIKRLWKIESDNFYEYIKEIKRYYRQIFKYIEHKKNKDETR